MSPDGRYYWDGQRWQPVPPAPGPPTALAPSTYPQPFQPQAFVMYSPSTNGLAVASLVFGILSWVLCPFIGGIVAVICGHVAQSQIKRTGESGSGLATTGLILGYLHIGGWIAFGVFWLFLFGGLAVVGALATATPSP